MATDAPERRPLPTLVLVILALFGLASIQNFTGPAPNPESSTETKREGKASPAGSASRRTGLGIGDQPEVRILGPLLDYFQTEEDGENLREVAFDRSRVAGLRFLIATVPDPVGNTNSNRFDEWIGAIQRACESEGFVLDGFRLPWGNAETPPEAPDRPQRKTKAAKPASDREPAASAPARKPAASAPAREPAASAAAREPGLLLFRGERTPGRIKVIPLLAVLLVPETPTLGLDKAAMGWSLELAATWDVRNRTPGGAKTFHILGPIFSGSQTSMEQALAGWTSRVDPIKAAFGALAAVAGPPATFVIISGSASAIRVEDLTKCVEKPHSVEFSATVHQSDVLLRALLHHVKSPAKIAMLVEANTQFGRSVRPTAGRADEEPVYYPFPLHISKVRGYYQKKGYLRDETSGTLRSFERLPIPFEDAGEPTDIPPMQTPGFTTAVDELVLGQILADIAHRNIRAVGIIATDPLDTIFLARQVHDYLPDVRLFTTESDLLYTHPQNIDALRGMLVASTYPLFPANQSWSYSYRGDVTHVFFSSESLQGTYNAAIAHLEVLGDPRFPARFLEYGLPFDPPGSYSKGSVARNADPPWEPKSRTPPVWIGVVGNHGVYPVRAVTKCLGEESRYLYVHEQQEAEYSDMLGLPTPSQRKEQAGSWMRIHNWFRPEFPHLWSYLFAGVSGLCLAWAGVALLVYRWAAAGIGARRREHFGIGPFPMDGLGQFLNCSRAGDAAKQGDCHGPGPYLPIGLVLLLLVYLAIIGPNLEVMSRVRWTLLAPWEDASFWVGSLAYTVLWVLSISIVLSLVAWRTTRRRARDAQGAGEATNAAVARDGPGAGEATNATTPARAPARRMLAILLGLVILGPPVFRIVLIMFKPRLAYAFDPVDDEGRDALIREALWMAIPSGVSPVLAMLFIGVAGLAWVYAQLRRRLLLEQYTPDLSALDCSSRARRLTGDAIAMQSIQDERELIDEVLQLRAWPFRKTRIIRSIVVAVLILLFIPLFVIPVVVQSLPVRWDAGSLSDAVAGLLIVGVCGLLGFHAVQLVVLWRHVRRVMGLALRLPLVSALDRIPSRVAGWLKESPRPGDRRFELIRRQALALAEVGEADNGAARVEDAVLSRRFGERRWKTLHERLKRLEPENVTAVIVPIREYLLDRWKPAPVGTVFPDAAEGRTEAAMGEGGIGPELHAIAAAISGEAVPPHQSSKRLPEWVRLAEELVAMLFMRWLAPALAQVWTLIGFLVVGSVALLFAVSSYPFPFQERLLLGIGLLIAVLVFMILAIVVGFNRDEMVSRLSNTAPNRLKFDGQLLGHLVAYIVPLVGALAALSPDVSDTLRSLLDPILRHLR